MDGMGYGYNYSFITRGALFLATHQFESCHKRLFETSVATEAPQKLGQNFDWGCPPIPVANEGLGWDPPTRNIIILIVTVTRQGDNPKYK